MANVLKAPEHVANIGYNGFPMQQYLKFSSTVGELLPVYYDILWPGDKVSGHVEHRTRTMPLETAAMCHVEEHFDWFAVPLDQIYSLSSMMLSGIQDVHSSIIKDKLNDAAGLDLILPYFNSSNFSSAFKTMRDREDAYFGHSGNPSNRYLYGTSLRLLELLGVPLADYEDDQVENPNSYPIGYSAFWLAAYQKIYFDYFRLSDREANNPYAYNLDTDIDTPSMDWSELFDLAKLRYRAASADFMTHNYVSPIFGFSSAQGLGEFLTVSIGDMVRQWLAPVWPATYSASDIEEHNPEDWNVNPNLNDPTFVSNGMASQNWPAAFSPSSITSLFAARKFLEITRRSAKHIDAQTLAHFGVKPSKRVAGEVIHLGHSSSTIVIGDVISTAQTEEGALGQVGGKGYNQAKSGKFEYKNEEPCPVILMCIYSAAPVYDYRQIGIDKLTTLINPADMFRPEFDNLGMQPMFEYQARMHFGHPSTAALNYGIIGWQYRWMEYKCKQNRVCGALARSLNNWTTYKDNVDASLRSRLVSPFDLDSIMVKPYDFNAHSGQCNLWAIDWPVVNEESMIRDPFDSDPLIHECYFDVKKASKMSAYGLESL